MGRKRKRRLRLLPVGPKTRVAITKSSSADCDDDGSSGTAESEQRRQNGSTRERATQHQLTAPRSIPSPSSRFPKKNVGTVRRVVLDRRARPGQTFRMKPKPRTM